jgi:hypothetical protein
MEEGRDCEIPHIVAFLRRDHDVHIDRERLRYIMKKSGFLFGTEILQHAGHMAPLLTPPYNPELQPIEKLWRDVKMYVARNYSIGRTFTQLIAHTLAGFAMYGTVAHCASKVRAVRVEEEKYRQGKYGSIDLTQPSLDSDDSENDDADLDDEGSLTDEEGEE